MKQFLALFGIIITSILTGCGGGAGTETGSGQQQASTATIVFSVTSTARLPIRVNNMQITANLPNEITCTANPIGKANVWKTDSAIFTVSPKQITFAVSDASQTQSGNQMGEFARLTCSINAGASLTESSFTSINNPFPAFDAVGFDTNGSSIRISSTDSLRNPYYPVRVTPSISVQFQ
jgi:hypothetical protein